MHTCSYNFHSNYLDRSVDLSFYQGDQHTPSFSHLIIINDGQDLHQMDLHQVLDREIAHKKILIVGCAAAAGERRKQEYGVQWAADYKGRGDKANRYSQFITTELLPWLAIQFPLADKIDKTIAGWSLTTTDLSLKSVAAGIYFVLIESENGFSKVMKLKVE